MRCSSAAIAALFLAVAAAGCDGIVNRLQSPVVAEGILADASDPFGAGAHQAGVSVDLASITGPLSQPQTAPIDGANITLTVGNGSPINLRENGTGSGVYTAISGSAGTPTFVYASNQTYALAMVVPAGDFAGSYTESIVAPPHTEVTGLPNLGTPIPHGQSLTLTVVGTYDQGIVVVLSSNGQITYDNRPKTPQEAVNFVLGSFGGTITIPGSAFPNPGTGYGIIVTGLRSAQPSQISQNLQILSRYYAGSAKTAVVLTN